MKRKRYSDEQVAFALGAPLDAFVVRKLGVPGREELAMGAVASGGIFVVNQAVVDHRHQRRNAPTRRRRGARGGPAQGANLSSRSRSVGRRRKDRASCEELRSGTDAVICDATPEPFFGVGEWCEDFSRTPDEEVRDALTRSRRREEHRATFQPLG